MNTNAYEIVASFFARARHPIVAKGEDHRFVFANDRACSMIGCSIQDLLGKTDHDFLPRVEADAIWAVDEHVLRSGEERLFEEEITAPDGSRRTLVTQKRRVPVPFCETPTFMVLAVIEDVTELRSAEHILRASEEHHRSLIELHPQTPWIADAAGRVVEVGPGWEQLSGGSVDDACGTGWMNVVHPDDLPHVVNSWNLAVQTGAPLDVEYRIRAPNGVDRWYRSRAAARVSPSGSIIRWYGLLEDVHDRHTALQALVASEAHLREHKEKLERLVDARTAEVQQKNVELARLLQQERDTNATQRRFVAMVSHEFRTPLTIIDAAAQRLGRLREAPSPEYLAGKALQIRGSVARMVELMESILAAGRLETGVIELSKKPSSIVELVQAAVMRRQELSPLHRIHIEWGEIPSIYDLDPSAMERVFSNLLSNAVKYAPQSPDIYVRGWCDEDTVHVSVQDTGVGMGEDDVPRLFEPYFRAQSATGIAGTGIGLNIVREIVELHDGTIGVVSEIGKGSTFTISLPYRSQSSQPKEAT
ncbi:sensor histidine kinase [Sphingomonas xinjiangensis]|uniref:histidine kinase n=1 Tax=Sphingomonas xinjiangensis TaxID=643568 RepID=A0A840YTI8_9SPHN|nr:ATP-binding protein [Sphingomonas xinjiangensis]MBB5712962.1 PAS domain S-box-containing protein [Sphingomonas xinjiangensis]